MRESGETYLKAIWMLERKTGYVRCIDVAKALGYSRPSVSRAIARLSQDGYVQVQTNGKLLLTKSGQQLAEVVYERFWVIARFLELVLGVAPEIAALDACKMEHTLSEESFQKLKSYVQVHQAQSL